MPKAKFYSTDGKYQSDIDLPKDIFESEIDKGAMHLSVTVYLGNQRQGTSKTKSKGEVSGSGKKPWKQKGTGRARAGTNTSPIWVRGGKAHGPLPRSYDRKLNKKFKTRALLSALSFKASESLVHVFEGLDLAQPKTKDLVNILSNAALKNQKNLILLGAANSNLLLAGRNIPGTDIGRVQDLNVYEILNTTNLIFTKEAVLELEKGKVE